VRQRSETPDEHFARMAGIPIERATVPELADAIVQQIAEAIHIEHLTIDDIRAGIDRRFGKR
jgi:hypothetical protein